MDPLAAIQRLAGGHFVEDLYVALTQVAEEVANSPVKGTKGAVTVTFVVTKEQAGEPMVSITEAIAKRPPKPEPLGAYFFAVDGGLHRENPNQVAMEFRVLDGGSETRRLNEQEEG